jgi:Icc-related predicted phosphoesterase
MLLEIPGTKKGEHAPPKGVPDGIGLYGETHVGSDAIAKAAKNFDIICCGHVHEQKNVTEYEGRICVNPGPAKDGNYAVITIEEDADPVVELRNIRERRAE